VAMIDHHQVRRIIMDAIGEHACLREARENGMYVIVARDRAIEICMPLAPRTIKKLASIPWASRIEKADLEQAALEGIIEAIDSYEPRRMHNGRPIQVNTHLFWRIRKRVYEEIANSHWQIARPSRTDMEAYMKGTMSEADRQAYINAVLLPVIDPEHNKHGTDGRHVRSWINVKDSHE
jgi:DNA-directed RNA polymerase specialized sigma subunit